MPVNPPVTGIDASSLNASVRTGHSIRIKTAAGLTIGLIQNWSPGHDRDITPVYEINAETSGLPIHNVPGNVKGLEIKVDRYDLYTSRIEQAFGTPDMTMLSDQSVPIWIQESWTYPDQGTTETWKYTGVWFKHVGRTISATDDRIIKVSASLIYLRKERTL